MVCPTVIFDACVLYPAPLRDLLLGLASKDLFRARWTDRIHEEWIRNLLVNRPDLTPAQLYRTKVLMNQAVPDCLIEDYEPLISTLTLPDPDDRYVLAAAIHARAQIIVTFNERDFPPAVLQKFGISIVLPDDFVMRLIEMDMAAVIAAAHDQRSRLQNPPKSIKEFLNVLQKQHLTRTVLFLQEKSNLL